MAIPFLNLVRKAKEKFEARKRPSTVAPLPSVQDKPEADKLAKRVTPYAVRTMTPEPSAPALAAASTMGGRRISLNRTAPGSLPDLGPSEVVSVEPRGERTVSLALSDVLAAMPQGYVKPNESFDTTRRVTLKAVEVEKGLATGRPSIPIATLYQQVPEIFEHTVVPSDTTVVVLPVQKVIDELSQLRVREDQTTDAISAQVETPFLKLMVEESAKFGTTVTPFETTELILPVDPVAESGLVTETARVEPVRPPASPLRPPATARPPLTPAVAKQPAVPPVPPAQPVQPAPAPRIPLTPPPSISLPRTEVEPNRDGSTPRVPLVTPTAQPDKNKPLSFGTGGSAFPRVPASSGPPVPSTGVPPAAPPLVTPPPVAPPTAGPTRIPFQSPDNAPAKGDAEQPKPVPLSPAPVPLSVSGAATPSQPGGQQMVTLPLRPILQSLPPMQLGGDVESVPADAKISFQISAIAPQLASGKVVIPPKEFHGALPEQYRGLFLPDAVEAPVQLSLPDVLANLPGDSLRMRDDQEVFAQDEIFETPFLAKAKEDAQRFAQSPEVTHAPQPVARTPKVETPKVELPAEVTAKAPKATVPAVPKVEPPPKVHAPSVQAPAPVDRLDISIMPATTSPAPPVKSAHEAPKFDAKAAITQACALAGVAACSVTFTDGLIVAGNIPDDMHMEGLSAVAPTMLKKLEKHMCETQLGPLTCITVHGEKSPVTFFSAGNLCLTAVHNGCELSAESRRELSRITQELSRTYPQLETAHVNH